MSASRLRLSIKGNREEGVGLSEGLSAVTCPMSIFVDKGNQWLLFYKANETRWSSTDV
jgi:hypothetical protein